MLTKLIPMNYRRLAWVVLAAIIAAAVAWVGHKATAAYYQPKVAKAEARTAEFEAAYTAIALASQNQNEAINDLEAKAREREAGAAKEVAKARPIAAARRDQATAIMRLRLPAGVDECRAARDAFDEELRQERGER